MNDLQSQTRVTGHFDSRAKKYFDGYQLQNAEGHSFRIRKRRCMDMLARLPRGSRVVDVGCGPATMVKELLDSEFVVTGTDIASRMIEECTTRFANEPRARFLVCSADQIPLSDSSQSAVTAMGLLEYLNDEPATLMEFCRLLKPDGIAIITFPHFWSPSRVWNRFTHLLAIPILALIGKRRQTSGVKHREYKLAPTLHMIRTAGFKIEDVVFYNFKLGFRPLDSVFPKLSIKIAEALERFYRTPLLRRIGTGFIVRARKL